VRASFSRPGLDEILRYRQYVDDAVERLLARDAPPEALRRIELGVNHEEQHQELLLTDILHAFFTNPLRPPIAPALKIRELRLHNRSGAQVSLLRPGRDHPRSDSGTSGTGLNLPLRFQGT